MQARNTYQRFHLTKKGWIDDITFTYLCSNKSIRLLSRQYGKMEEVEFYYFKETWKQEDTQEIAIYLALYPHPINDRNYISYNQVYKEIL